MNDQLSRLHVGCCGAFCGTCPEYGEGRCRGCKIGYDSGERKIDRCKCAIKACCLMRLGTQSTCADCKDLRSCVRIQEFHGKRSYKYGKYRDNIEYILVHGYARFLSVAADWKRAYGRL